MVREKQDYSFQQQWSLWVAQLLMETCQASLSSWGNKPTVLQQFWCHTSIAGLCVKIAKLPAASTASYRLFLHSFIRMPAFLVGTVGQSRFLPLRTLLRQLCQRTMRYLLGLGSSLSLKEMNLNQRNSLKWYSKSEGSRLMLTFTPSSTSYRTKKYKNSSEYENTYLF